MQASKKGAECWHGARSLPESKMGTYHIPREAGTRAPHSWGSLTLPGKPLAPVLLSQLFVVTKHQITKSILARYARSRFHALPLHTPSLTLGKCAPALGLSFPLAHGGRWQVPEDLEGMGTWGTTAEVRPLSSLAWSRSDLMWELAKAVG